TAEMLRCVKYSVRQIQVDGQSIETGCGSQAIHQSRGELPQPVRETLDEIEIQAARVSASVGGILRAYHPGRHGKAVHKERDPPAGLSEIRINRHAPVDHLYDKARPVAGFNCFRVRVIAIS